jgi:hypothetical protein
VVSTSFITPDVLADGKPDLDQRYLLPDPPSGLLLRLYSPAHLMLVDDQGRRSGMNGAGQQYDEIPDAIFRRTDEGESITVPGVAPDAAGWNVKLSGYDSGRYTLERTALGADGAMAKLSAGYARPGQVETVALAEADAVAARPVAADDAAQAPAAGIDIDPLANDFNTAGADVTITQPPAHGTATVTPARQIHYVPAAGYAGPDTLRYKLCASAGCGLSEAAVAITVLQSTGGGGPGGGGPGTGGPGGSSPPPPAGGGSGPGGGGGAQPPPGGGGQAAPAQPPALAVTAKRSQRARVGVKVRVSCGNEPCIVRLRARIGGRNLRSAPKQLAKGVRATLRLRRVKLRRPAKVRLTITAVDADGRRTVVHRTVRVR